MRVSKDDIVGCTFLICVIIIGYLVIDIPQDSVEPLEGGNIERAIQENQYR
jgi:hypothetical protein